MNDKLYEVALFNKELQVRIREINANNDELIEVNKLLQNASRNATARYESKIQRMQEATNHWMENVSEIFWVIDLNDTANTFATRGTLEFFNCSKKLILDQPNFWELSVHPSDKERVKNALLQLNTVDHVTIHYKHIDGKTMVSQTISLVNDENNNVGKIEFQIRLLTTFTPKPPKSLSQDLVYH